MLKIILSLFLGFSLTGCIEESSTRKERVAQEKLSIQAFQEAGLPAISRFAEKKTLKMILELRDKQTPTYTYIVTMNGDLKKICDSVGYGIPYATQYTNPQRYRANGVTLPQADPNGLFSPASADGTWVLCYNSTTKETRPVLVEPRIIVSPFPL